MTFRTLTCAVLLCAIPSASPAQDKPATGPDKPSTIADKIKGTEKIDGFVPLYWQASTGKLFLEVPRFNQELLYQISLPAGLGSNPVGLDRGQLGSSASSFFERVGQKVLLIQPNYRYRAISSDAAERRAVEDSFARSVLWGFKVEAEDGGRVLVDATAFFLRDAHGVADRLRDEQPGDVPPRRQPQRVLPAAHERASRRTREVETMLTFTTDGSPGRFVREATPTVVHHGAPASLVRRAAGRQLSPAPARSARPVVRHRVLRLRVADHRTDREALDRRHRLEKKDPAAARLRRRSSRSSITSTTARRSRSAARWSKARRGGARRSRRPGFATRSRCRCCPPTPTRWTCATT